MGKGKLYNIGHLSSQTISGGSILTDEFILNANSISGLAIPLYPSSATSKKYVDII